jgi:hypothetical protein
MTIDGEIAHLDLTIPILAAVSRQPVSFAVLDPLGKHYSETTWPRLAKSLTASRFKIEQHRILYRQRRQEVQIAGAEVSALPKASPITNRMNLASGFHQAGVSVKTAWCG